MTKEHIPNLEELSKTEKNKTDEYILKHKGEEFLKKQKELETIEVETETRTFSEIIKDFIEKYGNTVYCYQRGGYGTEYFLFKEKIEIDLESNRISEYNAYITKISDDHVTLKTPDGNEKITHISNIDIAHEHRL